MTRRFYSEALWGSSPAILRAETDFDKLRERGLPELANEADLATWLNLPDRILRWFSIDHDALTRWHYRLYRVPKRRGGERLIFAPAPRLKKAQRKVLTDLLLKIPAAKAAHGFVRDRSTLTNAAQHTGRNVLIHFDLKDFFPSIHARRVRGLFVSMGYGHATASALAMLCTEYERVPFDRNGTVYHISVGERHLVQGAPTSPAIANMIAWRMDQRLAGLAKHFGYTYTRYADDLTFSGDDPKTVSLFLRAVPEIVAAEHFAINPAKTRIERRGARQVVTGLTVNAGIHVRRDRRRLLRAILHNAAKTGLLAQNRDGHRDFRRHLQGWIHYIHQTDPNEARRLQVALDAAPDAAPEA
jgi:RNA-directed DNA polymerase